MTPRTREIRVVDVINQTRALSLSRKRHAKVPSLEERSLDAHATVIPAVWGLHRPRRRLGGVDDVGTRVRTRVERIRCVRGGRGRRRVRRRRRAVSHRARARRTSNAVQRIAPFVDERTGKPWTPFMVLRRAFETGHATAETRVRVTDRGQVEQWPVGWAVQPIRDPRHLARMGARIDGRAGRVAGARHPDATRSRAALR